MTTYDPYEFISGCFIFSIVTSLVVAVYVLKCEFSIDQTFLFGIMMFLLISMGKKSISDSEIDDDE